MFLKCWSKFYFYLRNVKVCKLSLWEGITQYNPVNRFIAKVSWTLLVMIRKWDSWKMQSVLWMIVQLHHLLFYFILFTILNGMYHSYYMYEVISIHNKNYWRMKTIFILQTNAIILKFQIDYLRKMLLKYCISN